MYVIKRRDRHEYFYDFDKRYYPPRVISSRIRKRLTFFKTFEDTVPVMRQLGNDWRVVQLKAVYRD